jgi:hypothetical protein
MVVHRVMMMRWSTMVMSQPVVRVHIVAMVVVHRLMRHRCRGGLGESRRNRNSRCDERRNK